MFRTSILLNASDIFFVVVVLCFLILSCRRYVFVLRIVLLLVMAWMTLLIVNSALVVVPVSIGRTLFNHIPLLPVTHGVKCNGNKIDSNWFSLEFLASARKILTVAAIFCRFIFFCHWSLYYLDCLSWG